MANSMFVLSVLEVKHCKLPGVAINGSSLQNQELFSHITSVVFKVKVLSYQASKFLSWGG